VLSPACLPLWWVLTLALQCLTANLKEDFGKMPTDCQVKLLHFATPRHEPVNCAVMSRSITLIIGPTDNYQVAGISHETDLCACSLALVGSFLHCWLRPIHQVLRLALLPPLCRGNRMHQKLRQQFLTGLTRVVLDTPSVVFATT